LDTPHEPYAPGDLDFDTKELEDHSDDESDRDGDGGVLDSPHLVCRVATLCSVCFGCCCLAFALGGTALIILGSEHAKVHMLVAGSALVGIVGLTVILSICCYAMMTFELDGHHFNCCNYYLPLLQQAILAKRNHSNAWYKSLTQDDPYIGHGPGPNTTSYYGWEDVVRIFRDWHPRIENGTMKRHGELGLSVFHSGPWFEAGTISTCLAHDDHAVARPYIGRVLDAAQLPETSPCDGSAGWNKTWLRSFFKKRFAQETEFKTTTVSAWIAQLFHKIHLDLDVSDEDAANFVRIKKANAAYSAFPPRTTRCPFFGSISGMNKFNKKRVAVVGKFKSALGQKFPAEEWDDEKLATVANMFCDSMLFAGGLSVPTMIQIMLQLWHDESAAKYKTDEASLRDFMLEAIRRYSPVGCVPRWITDDDGETWDHELCILRMANRDPRVFPDPMDFIPGRPGLNHADGRLSCSWADQLLVNNDVCHPHSHSCPGKQLSQEIIIAFFQEFLSAGPWTYDKTKKVSDLGAASMKLTKTVAAAVA
jgi:hypothetical protein